MNYDQTPHRDEENRRLMNSTSPDATTRVPSALENSVERLINVNNDLNENYYMLRNNLDRLLGISDKPQVGSNIDQPVDSSILVRLNQAIEETMRSKELLTEELARLETL